MNINDEKVINYLENKGELFQEGSWNTYVGGYLDHGREIDNHLINGNCKVVKKGGITLHEDREKEFLSTFEDDEEVTMLRMMKK